MIYNDYCGQCDCNRQVENRAASRSFYLNIDALLYSLYFQFSFKTKCGVENRAMRFTEASIGLC